MKLTVETLNAKIPQTIVLDVELDYAVSYVKYLIQDQIKIAFANQALLADGQVLSDSLRLIDCDFIRDRTIHLLLIDEYLSEFLCEDPFKVTVKTLADENLEMNIRSGDRVSDLKVQIRERKGFKADAQRFIFRGQQLYEDERMLFSYGVRKGSVLHLILRLGPPVANYDLQFRTLTGKTISMTGRDETVRTAIERVWKLEGPRAGNELTFNNEPLDNEKMILSEDLPGPEDPYSEYLHNYFRDAYKFKPHSILEFRNKPSTRAKDDLKVYVKFAGSETRKALTLIVKADHSIRSLKSAIQSKAGGRVKNLKLAGEDRELEDDRELSGYAVRNETVFYATLKLKLFVKRLDNGTIFRLDVQLDDRIGSIKEQIHHQEGISTDVQVLSSGTRRLEDAELVDKVRFKGRLILGLEVKSVRDLQISVSQHPWPLVLRDGIGRPISLSIKSNETIAAVKCRISNEINRLPDQQHLYFNGKQLLDCCTLDQLGAQDRVGLSFASRSNVFEISIVPTDRPSIEVEVNAQDTIKYLKSKLEQTMYQSNNVSRFPSDRQILTYEGQRLEDDHTLLHYRIGAGSELSVSLKVIELEVTVQTEFVERRALKVRSDCTWEMFVSEVKKFGLSICSENECSASWRYYNPENLSEVLVREPLMIEQKAFCNKCSGCARIQAFKQVTGFK